MIRVEVRPAEGGGLSNWRWTAGPADTLGRNWLASPNRTLMERLVADEWAEQPETLQPAAMPLTRLLKRRDRRRLAELMAATRADAARYAESDLLCYRADAPEALAERHALAYDPVLDWAAERLWPHASPSPPESCMSPSRPRRWPPSARRLGRHRRSRSRSRRLALTTSLTGSVLLALAVAHGRLTPEEAWRAAHIDEDFQAERWGVDDGAAARREARWREMEAAASALAALRGD